MNILQITGLLAVSGAFIYAIGDVLLLAGKVNLDDYPRLKPFQKLLSNAERMVTHSSQRILWGALLGVFATPLVLAGFWQVYQGLAGENQTLRLVVFLMFAIASIFGAFVHGTFFYMGEYVKALNMVADESQQIIAGMIQRHRKILIITYAPLLILVIIASILFSIFVASGKTAFPLWMTGITPLTMTIAWLSVKRILPQFIRDATEGAGFNIAYMTFFACTTISLWK